MLARLNGTRKALASNPNDFLVHLEKQLTEEYNLIMLQEEELWAIKSRLNWTAFGDRNTSFFHTSTMVRRHRNRIRAIKNNVGDWITDEEGVKDHIRPGFINLFTTELSYSTQTSDVEHFPCSVLSEWEKNKLSEEVTMAEVKAGM